MPCRITWGTVSFYNLENKYYEPKDDDEDLEGEDSVGVEKDGIEPERVDLVEGRQHDLLVHIKPVEGTKLFSYLDKDDFISDNFEFRQKEMCKIDCQKSHRCRMLIVLTDSVLLSNWS